MQAVILAGGKGTRLKPYTLVFPKPLMPIGDMPILEIVIRQLRNRGFKKIVLSVGYLAELMEAYFGDGRKWNVEISYSRESKPLGTAGSVALVKEFEDDFIVMNGDILADLDFLDLLNYHIKEKSMVTVAVCDKDVTIDLGILKTNEDDEICDYIEKPTLKYQVSAGVYAYSKNVLRYIKGKGYMDFPDLVRTLIRRKERVKAYWFNGHWLDIGRSEDYEKAVKLSGRLGRYLEKH